MTAWENQLRQIAELREHYRTKSDNLLASRLKWHAAVQANAKANRGEIRRDAPLTDHGVINWSTTDQSGTNDGPAENPLDQVIRDSRLRDAAREKLHNAIEGLYLDTNRRPVHPGKLLGNFSDGIPFLLLPLRIETRFVTQGQSNELWVRVYPDDIAVHTHEKELTPLEIDQGQLYWTEMFKAKNKAEVESESRSLWSHLAGLFTPQRAAWVATSTRPANFDTAIVVDELQFPIHALIKEDDWSRAPKTNVLPDQFVLLLYELDGTVTEHFGIIVPDELIAGPDPLDAEAAFKKDGKGELTFGDEFAWVSDFDKAVACGMGFKVPLSVEQAARGFTKLVVIGLNLSSDASASQKQIETLFDNHHYAPGGLSLVPQGTATNNTEEAPSGYTRNDPFYETTYFVETGNPLFTEGDDCDGCNLANALGIDYKVLTYVQHADGKDYAHAIDMNRAMFPGTLGYYFDSIFPVLKEEDQDRLRSFFTRHVTGRGPIPAIRVKNQPYGILLTSDFAHWKWSRGESEFGNTFIGGLYAVLDSYQQIWSSLLDKVSWMGRTATGDDPDALLMNILGLQPSSVDFHQRVAYSTQFLATLDRFKHGGRYYDDMAKSFTSKSDVLQFLEKFGFKGDPPQLLRLVYQHFHTPLDPKNLVDSIPLSEKEGIRFYDEENKKNYLHWLSEAASEEVLEAQDFGGAAAPNALLYLMLRRSLLLQLHEAAVRWLGKNNIDVKETLRPTNFHNILAEPTISRWEVMKGKVGLASPQHPLRDITLGKYLLNFAWDQDESQFLGEMRQSMKNLAGLSTAELERCFTEHLDTCAYRLDAWQTGMFDLRLKNQRKGSGESGSEREMGIYLGSYGWVEDLRPSPRKQATENIPKQLVPQDGSPLFEFLDNNGFVQAPSLNQAITAAVLKSGYASHASGEHPDIFSVNLSSERVRRAQYLLGGIRNGQKLEALLGYQFERGLHDAASADASLLPLNEYIYDFRDRFPLQTHYIQQEGTGLAVESIPANNVVNGLKLAEATGDMPYGATGSVTAASEDAKAVIRREKQKLEDSLDAVKDLLTSEAVYQMVTGNFDRAGAVVNAMKDAGTPPEIEILNTPRSTQLGITNRVAVAFSPGAAASSWPGEMTARATMEPGLNQWLGTVLDKPEQIRVRVSHLDAVENELSSEIVTLDKINIQPIDLVYISGEELNTGRPGSDGENRTASSELESRIAYHYRAGKGLSPDVTIKIEFKKPAGQKTLAKLLPLLRNLRSVLTNARPLHAMDFDPVTKESASDKRNPKGFDLVELRTRVHGLIEKYGDRLNNLREIDIDAKITDAAGNIQHFLKLGDTFDGLHKAKLEVKDASYTFTDANAKKAKELLINLSEYALSFAFPNVHEHNNDHAKLVLLQQAGVAMARMTEVKVKAEADLASSDAATSQEAKMQLLVQAARAILGEDFNVLPRFHYNNEADIVLSHADEAQLLSHAKGKLGMDFPVEEWLHQVSHVRPNLYRWNSVMTFYESYNEKTLDLHAVQLPYRAKDSWLAVEYPDKDPQDPEKPFEILHDTISMAVHGESAFTGASLRCGLLIDEWSENTPLPEETTGISFHYNAPSTMAPQVLLLAVTPEVTGSWKWESLVNTINDTMLRMKCRAVEPRLLDEANKPEVSVLLPAILSEFSQFDLNVSLDYRINIHAVAHSAAIQTVHKTKK